MELSVDQIKNKALPTLKEAGVKRCSLFGSAARGEADLDSDIDFLVELPEKSSLLDLVRLERRLEEILGRKVDLLTYSSIYPSLRPYIQKDQLSILWKKIHAFC